MSPNNYLRAWWQLLWEERTGRQRLWCPNLSVATFNSIPDFSAETHGSAIVMMTTIQSVLDPETEYKRASGLMVELVTIDQWLQTYKRKIR